MVIVCGKNALLSSTRKFFSLQLVQELGQLGCDVSPSSILLPPNKRNTPLDFAEKAKGEKFLLGE